MIPAHLMSADIEIKYRNSKTRDRYNLPVDDADSRSTFTVKAYYRPRRSESVVDGGEQVLAGMLLILQPDVPTEGIELVMIEGKRYETDGQAQPHWHPIFKKVAYNSIVLRRGTTAEVT